MSAIPGDAPTGTYTAYGLEIRSVLPLPELVGAGAGQPDVTIGFDPAGLPDPHSLAHALCTAVLEDHRVLR